MKPKLILVIFLLTTFITTCISGEKPEQFKFKSEKLEELRKIAIQSERIRRSYSLKGVKCVHLNVKVSQEGSTLLYPQSRKLGHIIKEKLKFNTFH